MHGAEPQRAARALSFTRSDLDGRAVGAEEDGSKVVAHLVRAIAAVERVALPELAVAVRSPALDAAVVEHGAAVCRSCAYSYCREGSRGRRQGPEKE
mgnify:CR=1 FL=1